jgi:hypothetical protein
MLELNSKLGVEKNLPPVPTTKIKGINMKTMMFEKI